MNFTMILTFTIIEEQNSLLPKNETPVTIWTSNTIGCVRSRKLLRLILDSGSTECLIKIPALQKCVVPKTLSETKSFNTLSGKLTANDMVTIRDICLPEFDTNRSISQQRALIFDNDSCQYDMIIGTKFLSKTGI